MGKKRASSEIASEEADWWTVNVLGANTGARLRGVRETDDGLRNITPLSYDSVRGVVLEVAQGAVLPHVSAQDRAKRCFDSPGQDPWDHKLAAKLGVSPPQAGLRIAQFKDDALASCYEGMLGNTGVKPRTGEAHAYKGVETRFKIVEIGAWAHSEVMQKWQEAGALVTPGELVVELDRAQKADPAGKRPGFLALRPHLWVEAPRSGRVDEADVETVDVHVADVLCGPLGMIEGRNEQPWYYRVEAEAGTWLTIAMPPCGSPFEIDRVPSMVFQAVQRMRSDACSFQVEDEEGKRTTTNLFGARPQGDLRWHIEHTANVLRSENVHFGVLKSMTQKLARIQADKVRLPTGDVVDGRIVVMVALAYTFTTKGGGFVPNIGKYVRGQVAAMKRLGVTMVEDAWPERTVLKGLPGNTLEKRDPGRVLEALMGAALVCSQVEDYYVPDDVVENCLYIMAASLHSPQVIAWRPKLKNVAPNGHASIGGMRMSARILRVLRSFEGDLAMFDQAANMVKVGGVINVKENEEDPSGIVPLHHAIDQHVYRGFAHAILNFTDEEDSFARRFRLTFNRVTGFSPRLADADLDEADAIVRKVRFAQKLVELNVFSDLTVDRDVNMPIEEEMDVPLDNGVMSAGVGTLGPYRVTTTVEENTADGYYPGGKPGPATWNLLVILPVEKPGCIVIQYVSAHANDNSKKPPVTSYARDKAIAKAKANQPWPFRSQMMPGYNQVWFGNGVFNVTGPGKKSIEWHFDRPNVVNVSYSTFLSDDEKIEWHKNSAVFQWMRERVALGDGITMTSRWQETLLDMLKDTFQKDGVVREQGFSPRQILLRLLGQIKQQYSKVALPTPNLHGGVGSDQLKCEPGDWIVWRLLLAISRICPGALRAEQLPTFSVPDSRMLRMVEATISQALVVAPDSAVQDAFVDQLEKFEALFGTNAIDNREPFDYQTALVNSMLLRDRKGVVKTQGHFVSLETGLGKSLVGFYYGLQHIAEFGGCNTILWVTPNNVIKTALGEMTETWGLPKDFVRVVSREKPGFCAKSINIVGFEWFSSGGTRGELEKNFLIASRKAFIVFDEVHLMYNANNIRNSIMREAALACPKFVCMTATPIGAPSQAIAIEWLKDTVGFPVARENQLVASAMMVAARVELPIEGKEVLMEHDLSSLSLQEHNNLLQNGRKWNEAAAVARLQCMDRMAALAVELALEDRKTQPDGGVLVIADNANELQALEEKVRLIDKVKTGKRGQGNADKDKNIAVLFATKTDVTGYNLTRMGAIITGVYASSAAKRHQLRGRIRRVGQTRKEVQYVTVVPKNTILELLHRRHNSVDKANESLAELAEVFLGKGMQS